MDPNGYIYIGEIDFTANTSIIKKLTAYGVIIDANWKTLPYSLFNFFGTDDGLFVRDLGNDGNGKVSILDWCTGELIGCPTDANTGWGFSVSPDEQTFYSTSGWFGPTESINKGSTLLSSFGSPTCTTDNTALFATPIVASSAASTVGVTVDEAGNVYTVTNADDGGFGAVYISKYNAAGVLVATSATDATADQVGYFGARGIVYSSAAGKLYVGSLDDCIAVFDTDLNYLPALSVPYAPATQAKAIGILNECCASPLTQTTNDTYCEPEAGKKIFLRDYLGCPNVPAGEYAIVGPNSVGTYNECDQSITLNGSLGSFQYKYIRPASANNTCGETEITVNLMVNDINKPQIAGNQHLCVGSNPTPLTLTNIVMGGGTITYQWQSSTTSCETGFTNIANATTTSYDPPAGIAQTTYFRLLATSTLSGFECIDSSNCVTVGTFLPDAGENAFICLPKTTLKLKNAPSGNEWVAASGNPATATINASTGAITGMTATGVYTFTLQTVGDASCKDDITVTVSPASPPHLICNDGSNSVTATAQPGTTNVIWFNAAGAQVGSGPSLTIDSNTVGLADGNEWFYYTAQDAEGYDAELFCPVVIIAQDCCPTPNCLGVTVIRN